MGLLQEWYVQETKDSEEEKFHRSLNDEQLFFHAVSSGDIDYVRQNCKEKRFAETEGVGIIWLLHLICHLNCKLLKGFLIYHAKTEYFFLMM